MSFRRLLSNVVCGFIPNQKTRSRVRVVLNNPSIKSYVKFVRHWANENCGGTHKLKLEFGVGCHNLVVLLNDKYVFKFFLVPGREARAYHEERFVKAFRDISPIKLPEMELMKYKDTVLRRYEFVAGKMLTDFDASYIVENKNKIAKQLARFLYEIGRADPAEIRDLKPTPYKEPGFLYGWFHNDIGNNFILDDDLNIVGFIDCEKACFCDYRDSLANAEHFWDKNGYRGLMVSVLAEYAKLYYGAEKK